MIQDDKKAKQLVVVKTIDFNSCQDKVSMNIGMVFMDKCEACERVQFISIKKIYGDKARFKCAVAVHNDQSDSSFRVPRNEKMAADWSLWSLPFLTFSFHKFFL